MHVNMAHGKESDSPEEKPSLQMNIQSKAHETLLNAIDQLRSQGITHLIDLPQIIVCGDQSSGKSSVLEAVSGVKFPTKDALCTRFATELILRRNVEDSTKITIVPDPKRPDDERKKLQAFQCSANLNEDFATIIDDASKAMGLDGVNKNFGSDVLRIEVSGPSQPHLTLVDLPGLFHSGTKAQTDADVKAVHALVRGYMKKPRSIILAVVAANNDANNQIVIKYAKELDKGGARTLGIITKPDIPPEGSTSEANFLKLARNQEIEFQLGWHVLKNREYVQRHFTNAQRDAAEREFFDTRVWGSLGRKKVGVDSLRPRLSQILQEQILKELPSLLSEIKEKTKECQRRLETLGPSRGTTQEQALHLHSVSDKFVRVLNASVGGSYDGEFFIDASSDEGYARRIRAVVVNSLADFSDTVARRGHKYQVVEKVPTDSEDEDEEDDETEPEFPIKITQEARLKQISNLLRRSRGTELPGFIKEDTVTTLFRNQCSPWEGLVREAAETIFETVRYGVLSILHHVCDEATYAGLVSSIVTPQLEQVRLDFERAVDLTLDQHVRGRPVTFNHYFTDNVQKLRNDHNAEHVRTVLHDHFGKDPKSEDCIVYRTDVNVRTLLKVLSAPTEADMNRFACSEALYFMQAYYKVARKFFVDDFAQHAVEQQLLARLETILNPKKMLTLSEEMIEEIAGEREESKQERRDCSITLEALNSAATVLKKLDRGRSQSSGLMDTPARNKIRSPAIDDDLPIESDSEATSADDFEYEED